MRLLVKGGRWASAEAKRKLLLPFRSLHGDDAAAKFPAVKSVIEDVTAKLEGGGVPEAGLSARHLVAAAMDIRSLDSLESQQDGEFPSERLPALETMCDCRLARMPVQYILQEWDFRRLSLRMRPPVFIPRPETEELVGLVLQRLRPGHKVLEIGCGSGAVALSLLREGPSGVEVTAVDRSGLACALTAENAEANGLMGERLKVAKAKLLDDGSFEEEGEGESKVGKTTFDVVVSNPPYVPRKDVIGLEPEVRLYEDLRALDGGKEGLDVTIPILTLASKRLVRGGSLFLEVDPCHRYLLPQVLEKDPSLKLGACKFVKDFREKDRFAIFEKSK